MGDGGWRRIDAPAARHFLTLLSLGRAADRRLLLGPIRKGGAPSAPPFPLRSRSVEGCVSAARSREAR